MASAAAVGCWIPSPNWGVQVLRDHTFLRTRLPLWSSRPVLLLWATNVGWLRTILSTWAALSITDGRLGNRNGSVIDYPYAFLFSLPMLRVLESGPVTELVAHPPISHSEYHHIIAINTNTIVKPKSEFSGDQSTATGDRPANSPQSRAVGGTVRTFFRFLLCRVGFYEPRSSLLSSCSWNWTAQVLGIARWGFA